VTFTEHYLRALDDLLPPPAPPPPTRGRAGSYAASLGRREFDQRVARRADTMIGWHLILLDRFNGTQDDALLDRLAGHAALGGPEHTYFTARLAWARRDLPAARTLTQQGLDVLPGHAGLLALARETGTPLPARAAAVAASRRTPPP
jgi:hypothetical protein